MDGKFMAVKRIVVPIMTLVILASQLTGCAAVNSNEMVKMINAGQSVTIEVAKPDYTVHISGTAQKEAPWVQLSKLNTFNNGFRQGYDELFNINIITNKGVNSKSGCLFVDAGNQQDGNTTLADAFRNKVFVTKYWNNPDIINSMNQLASQAYTDVAKGDTSATDAALNAYYDLTTDNVNPSSFNATQSLSREQFYAMYFKAKTKVTTLTPDVTFDEAIGGKTALSNYAQGVAKYGFLQTADKSLDSSTYTGSISRAEAIYLVVNANFPDLMEQVPSNATAFRDTKNAGDLALKVGFKTVQNGQETSKDRWQAYTLAYMMQHPDQGMQQELFNAMAVAHNLGLISGPDSRWDEPISKSEAIQLIVNTELAKDKIDGYTSTVEYGTLVPDKVATSGTDWADVPTAEVPISPNQIVPKSGMTMAQIKQQLDQIKRFEKSQGMTDTEVNTLLKKLATDYGTTLQALNQVQEPPTPVVKQTAPAKTAPAKQQSSVSSGSSGSNDDTAIDPAFKGHMITSKDNVSTVPDPNFNLH